jgi:hypothetical protein
MMQLARSASLIVVLLLASVGTASAECAWVLWTRINALEWETRGGFETRADCERERGKSAEGVLQGTGGKEFVVLNACLPDTVDPRRSTTNPQHEREKL